MAKRPSGMLHHSQRGFILPMVLVMLAVGALLLIPTLQFAWASLNANKVTEWKSSELYDADAGVEEAIRWVQYDGVTGNGWDPVEDGHWQRMSLDDSLNGSDVAVDVEQVDTGVYKITSTATGEETDTTIVAYVVLEYSDLSFLLENAITSNGSVDIPPGVVVNGDVRLPDDDDLKLKGEINGDVKTDETEGGPLDWPEAEDLMDWYMDSLESEASYTTWAGNTTLNIPGGTSEADPYAIGPGLCTGNLTLKGNGWVRLDGTIYVQGDFTQNPTPSINLDLNQQTVFAEGSIYVGPKVTISNSGCFIAVGEVDFQPNIATVPEGEEEPFVLIMSITDETKLRPGGNFYGSVVGEVVVDLQPGVTITWVSPEGKGINFPMGDGSQGHAASSITVPSYVIN